MLFLLLVSIVAHVAALPSVTADVVSVPNSSATSTSSSGSSSFSAAIWIPIIVVGVVILGIIIVCQRFRLYKKVQAWNSGAARQRTVEESSSSPSIPSTGITAGTTANRPRRGRRGRTPSQISTRSLPAYMKDPGDEEVVIYSGPTPEDEYEDTESADNSLRATMPAIDEHSSSHLSLDMTQSQLVATQLSMTTSYNDQDIRPSFDTTMASDESSSALLRSAGDARGEAPPYEFINLNEPQHTATLSQDSGEHSSSSPEISPVSRPPQTERNRISGFFSRLMPRGHADENTELLPSSGRHAAQHNRERSGPSPISLTTVESRTSVRGGQPRRGHRASNSSGSMMSLAAFRNRTRSNVNDSQPLTSPSLISLNSISAPLTYTASRTEFTYPRSGPTPDQIKFISSRDTFGRFGVPYGPDAVLYAASSRQDLVPPPEFETIVGNGSTDSSQVNASSDPASADADPGTESTGIEVNVDLANSTSLPSASQSAAAPTSDQQPTSKYLPYASPSSSRLDASNPEHPRSVSVASSYATFQTAHESELSSTPVPQLQDDPPSSNPSSESLHTVQAGRSDDDEGSSKTGGQVDLHTEI